MKATTLCFVIVDGRVLLAMKKRGFGAGKWNGPGGKVQEGESVEEACRREAFEETGVTVGALRSVGIIEFVFDGKPEWDNQCHVFVAHEISGEPEESEEMRPQWFDLERVPFKDMWEDDAVWLPEVLRGGTVRLRFFFDANMKLTGHESLS